MAAEFSILRILNEENHQKRDDSRARVDYELPSIGEMEERTGDRPHHHGPDGKCKDPGSPGFAGSDLRNFSEQLVRCAEILAGGPGSAF